MTSFSSQGKQSNLILKYPFEQQVPYNSALSGRSLIKSHAALGIAIEIFNIFLLIMNHTHFWHATVFFFQAWAVVAAEVFALSNGSGMPTDIQESELHGVGWPISIPSGCSSCC